MEQHLKNSTIENTSTNKIDQDKIINENDLKEKKEKIEELNFAFATDNELFDSWLIEKDNALDSLPLFEKKKEDDNENCSKILETKRKNLVPIKKTKNHDNPLLNNKEIEVQETRKTTEASNLPCTTKKRKCSPDNDFEVFVETKMNKLNLGPSLSTDIPNLSHLASSSKTPSSLKSLCSQSALNIDLNLERKLLQSFYNKVYLENCTTSLLDTNLETNKHVKTSPLETCSFAQDISKNIELIEGDEDSHSEDSEPFVEDPDIVNPHIMYNIDLNEHYKQMDILVEKIGETPDDPTLLEKCMELQPIPKIEHELTSFTEEERLNFTNGISEWEYEIDSVEWNKIMVKRSVVFATHAGFNIANEESLYVLADVAIDYIKKVALIMKKHFDIQSDSSCPDSIDPINNSLLEIGITGGIRELLKHYENDIFGRRDKLTKKCQHLQKIIDQYVNKSLIGSKTTITYFDEGNSISDKDKTKVQTTNKNKTEVQLITDEIQTEIQSAVENIVSLNAEFKNTDDSVICIDDVDTDVIDDTNSKNINNIETNTTMFGDGQTDLTQNVGNKTMNLLRPLVEPLGDIERTICNVEERYLNTINLDTQSTNLFKTKYFEHFEKKGKLKDRELSSGPLNSYNGIPNYTPNYTPQDTIYEIPVDFAKIFNDLETKFESCRIKLTPRVTSLNIAESSQSDKNRVPHETVFDQNSNDNVEKTTSLDSNLIQNISVVDNIDMCDDSDNDLL